MAGETVMRVEGLWKRYGLPMPRMVRRGADVFRRFRNPQSAIREPDDGPWALRDVDLDVGRGDTVGIIGRNGAGKSTLLKVLAGVTPPTHGRVEVRGRLFPMIELNAGLHTDLTGRENVWLLGAVMGLSRSETRDKLEAIQDFCDLGRWFDLPVRKYSSGMLARLGFAVAVNSEADILLIDEVLAVGDLPFQRKCMERMERLRSRGVTTLLVSHNTRQIERLCERAILLEEGRVSTAGPTREVTEDYYRKSHATPLDDRSPPPLSVRFQGTGDMIVQGVTFLDENGRAGGELRSGSSATVRLEFVTRRPIDRPVIALGILTTDMLLISAFSNEEEGNRPNFDGEGWYDCTIPELPFLPGVYSVKVKLMYRDGSLLYDNEDAGSFLVVPSSTSSANLASAGFFKTKVLWPSQPRYRDPSEKQ
jgi:lipopolysaccharide transport system ATP-binding protein